MKAYDGSNFALPKSNEEYIAIWDDMNLGPYLPLEKQVENEIGAYVALRHEIIVTEDEKKRKTLGKSLQEWFECQLHDLRRQVLDTVEPDAVAVWEAAELAPNAKDVNANLVKKYEKVVNGTNTATYNIPSADQLSVANLPNLAAVNARLVNRVRKAARPKKPLPMLGG
jgi:hypothetical protein